MTDNLENHVNESDKNNFKMDEDIFLKGVRGTTYALSVITIGLAAYRIIEYFAN